jgi:proton glutamate symport protein
VKRIKLHWWILIGMVLGALAGSLVNAVHGPEVAPTTGVYHAFDGLSRIFLKLLKMIVVPLVFFSLVSGMLGMGSLSQLGRMGIKTFALYVTTSLLAILTGLTLVNTIRPGVGLGIEIPTEAVTHETPQSFWDVLVEMVPDNVVGAAARFDLLGVIIFALLFGAFLLTLRGERKRTLVSFMEGGSEVMMRMTGFIISLAPVGIGALVARLVSSTGLEVFYEMRWYVVTVFLGLAIHVLVTLPLLLVLVLRYNPYPFLTAMSPALVTGFSTASSSGTLGVTLERAEHGAGISNRVASFVLPLGATINMDGTALYEIVSVLFIAQVHAGVDPNFTLTLGQQLLIVFLGLTVSIGAAGIPHAGLVMMVIILQAVGLPLEYTGLIWTVDRILDMCRTATNITSDSSIAMIVAHTEGEVDASVLAGD